MEAISFKTIRLAFILVAFGLLLLIAVYYLRPRNQPAPHPQVKQGQVYSYYQIFDEKTGKNLMNVSSAPVQVGDELITADNRRYVVIRVNGNQAYAKFVEKVKM